MIMLRLCCLIRDDPGIVSTIMSVVVIMSMSMSSSSNNNWSDCHVRLVKLK